MINTLYKKESEPLDYINTWSPLSEVLFQKNSKVFSGLLNQGANPGLLTLLFMELHLKNSSKSLERLDTLLDNLKEIDLILYENLLEKSPLKGIISRKIVIC